MESAFSNPNTSTRKVRRVVLIIAAFLFTDVNKLLVFYEKRFPWNLYCGVEPSFQKDYVQSCNQYFISRSATRQECRTSCLETMSPGWARQLVK